VPPEAGGRAAAVESELAQLVARLRAAPGDELALSALDRALRPRLAGYFRAGGAAPTEVDDLVQETLRRVFAGVTALRSAASFVPWLFTVARNVRSTSGARQGRDPLARAAELDGEAATSLPDSGAPDPEARLLAREAAGRLERALAELPPRQRQCLLLRVRDELSYAEIAELLGTSALTVRNHLAQARAELRRRSVEVR
jgi:RNA polymerase sigma-70 factor (ECF subfamily)